MVRSVLVCLALVCMTSAQVCNYNNNNYADGAEIDDICMILKCTAGSWKYQGKIRKKCGTCKVWGDPLFQPFSNGYYSFQGKGSFILTQKGLTTPADFLVTSYFEPEANGWNDYTAPRDVKYKEPGFHIDAELVSFQKAKCFNAIEYNPDDPDCKITAHVNSVHHKFVENIVVPFNDDKVLIFDHKHTIDATTTRCLNIVGSKGISISLCMSDDYYYSFLYIWAMPNLQSELNGMCDTYTAVSQGSGYTMPDGSSTHDVNAFAKSWKVPANARGSYFAETSNVDDSVSGQYSFTLPDGSIQIITYTADENGYQAKYNGVQNLVHNGNRCTLNVTSVNIIKNQCETITNGVCAIIPIDKCDGLISGCKFDLCRVSNPDAYIKGFADHLLIESHFYQHY